MNLSPLNSKRCMLICKCRILSICSQKGYTNLCTIWYWFKCTMWIANISQALFDVFWYFCILFLVVTHFLAPWTSIVGVFLAVSSNTRYQIVNGLERVVEASPLAKQVPPVALAFTVGVRFANNVYGGMQFVDWARWSGVQ